MSCCPGSKWLLTHLTRSICTDFFKYFQSSLNTNPCKLYKLFLYWLPPVCVVEELSKSGAINRAGQTTTHFFCTPPNAQPCLPVFSVGNQPLSWNQAIWNVLTNHVYYFGVNKCSITTAEDVCICKKLSKCNFFFWKKLWHTPFQNLKKV